MLISQPPVDPNIERVGGGDFAASASLVTPRMTSGYGVYYLVITSLVTSAGPVNLDATLSDDNGSTWVATNYHYNIIRALGTAITAIQSAVATSVPIATSLHSVATYSFSAVFTLLDPANVGNGAPFSWTSLHREAGGNHYHYMGQAVNQANAAYDRFRLLPSAGNLASGRWDMYGVSV